MIFFICWLVHLSCSQQARLPSHRLLVQADKRATLEAEIEELKKENARWALQKAIRMQKRLQALDEARSMVNARCACKDLFRLVASNTQFKCLSK
jgi:hypothetical protein